MILVSVPLDTTTLRPDLKRVIWEQHDTQENIISDNSKLIHIVDHLHPCPQDTSKDALKNALSTQTTAPIDCYRHSDSIATHQSVPVMLKRRQAGASGPASRAPSGYKDHATHADHHLPSEEYPTSAPTRIPLPSPPCLAAAMIHPRLASPKWPHRDQSPTCQ